MLLSRRTFRSAASATATIPSVAAMASELGARWIGMPSSG